MSRPRRWLLWTSVRVYQGLLRCFPRDFRSDPAPSLQLEVRVALGRAAERGLSPLITASGREITDLAWNLVLEWIVIVRRKRTMDGRRGAMTWLGMGQDIRFALRGLRRRAGLTSVIVATMAIAIGGTTATFGVVDAVLLDPLPYPESNRLVYLYESFRETQIKSLSYLNYLDWRAENRVFEDLAARASWGFIMTGEGDARELSAMLLSANALEVLGIEPALGSMFTVAETDAEARLILLSHAMWQTAFASDPAMVGRSLTLDGQPYIVTGVMPPDIEFPISGVDVWAPITTLSDSDRNSRGSHPGIGGIARLRPGVTLEAASEDMARVTADLSDRYPDTNAEAGAKVAPIMDILAGNSRRTLYLILGAVGMVLLIACANVANLLLVQATGRSREAALRIALGAPRSRIVRLLMTESVLLGLAGGSAGVFLAGWTLAVVRVTQPGGLPRLESAGLDAGVLTFALVVSLTTALLFGLGPALHVSGANPLAGLKNTGGRGHTRSGRTKRALIVFEVATAFVLLVGAGLMIRSVDNLLGDSAGIATSGRLTFRAAVPTAKYPTLAARAEFYRQLIDRLVSLPGVATVAGVDPLPMTGSNRQMALSNEGFPQLDATGLRVDVASISPDYFDAFALPLMAGTTFTGTETIESPSIIVDEMLARTLWPDEGALGRQLRLRADESPWMTVIGVAPHVNHYGVQWDSRGKLYFPYTARVFSLSFVVEAVGDPLSLVEPVRYALSELDPDVPLTRVATMSELRAESIADEALTRRVLEIFGLVALVLAVLGLYGVLSHSVAEQRREIGIRIALGARAQRVLAGVLREGVLLSGLGVVLGFVGVLVATRMLESLLYGVGSFDRGTLGTVAAVLMSVAVFSAALPASRAVRVDPSLALRDD